MICLHAAGIQALQSPTRDVQLLLYVLGRSLNVSCSLAKWSAPAERSSFALSVGLPRTSLSKQKDVIHARFSEDSPLHRFDCIQNICALQHENGPGTRNNPSSWVSIIFQSEWKQIKYFTVIPLAFASPMFAKHEHLNPSLKIGYSEKKSGLIIISPLLDGHFLDELTITCLMVESLCWMLEPPIFDWKRKQFVPAKSNCLILIHNLCSWNPHKKKTKHYI